MGKWSPEDDLLVKSQYGTVKPEDLSERLGGRSWTAIAKRAQYLAVHRPRTNPNSYAHFKSLELWERAWIACALDGEGTIGIGSHGKALDAYISVSNTKEPFVARFKEILRNENRIHYHIKHRNEYRRNAIYQYAVGSGPLIYVLLREIMQFLVIKREQAKLVMRFLEIQFERRNKHYTEEQWTLYKEVKRLNQRWHPDTGA